MWEAFLRGAPGQEYWICGKCIPNKLKDTRKHFEAKHWLTSKPAKTLQQQEDTIVSQALRGEIEEAPFNDAVEAIPFDYQVPPGKFE